MSSATAVAAVAAVLIWTNAEGASGEIQQLLLLLPPTAVSKRPARCCVYKWSKPRTSQARFWAYVSVHI